MAMDSRAAVRQQLAMWHPIVDQIVGECSPEALTEMLPGATIGPIAAIYAHIVSAEDAIVQGMLQGKAPLYQAEDWAAKIGIDYSETPTQTLEWAKGVRLDPATFRPYAEAVYQATDAYLAGVSDTELARTAQTPIGEQTHEWMIVNVLGTHLPQHMGEIAALRGVHGHKGLPF